MKITFEFNNFNYSGELERSTLKRGIHNLLDDYDELTKDYTDILNNILKRFSQLLDSSDTSVKLEYDDRLYCYLKFNTIVIPLLYETQWGNHPFLYV